MGLCATTGAWAPPRTWSRRPVTLAGTMRRNQGLFPSCHGSSGSDMAEIVSLTWRIGSACPFRTTLHALPSDRS